MRIFLSFLVPGRFIQVGYRRRRSNAVEFEFARAIVGLIVLVGVGMSFSPEIRAAVYGLGMLVIGLVALGMVACVVWLVLVLIRKQGESRREREDAMLLDEGRNLRSWSMATLAEIKPDSCEILPAIEHVVKTVAPKPAQVSLETDEHPSRKSVTMEPASSRTSTRSLIDELRAIDWFQFEKVVGVLYEKAGYRVTPSGGANPDGGIDITVEKNGETVAIQCKHWKTWNLGVKPVREFLGALTDHGLRKGVMVTLCGFTGEAKDLADRHGIRILNERDLALMLRRVDADDPRILSILRDPKKYCPKCKSEMILRLYRHVLAFFY